MAVLHDAVWLNVSPAFQEFNQPCLNFLSQSAYLSQYKYYLSLDEPLSFNTPLIWLHNYLKNCDYPVHLIGHGISGLLGLLYARQHPEMVRSLTLISVGFYPSVDWQAHYYVQRQLLNCSQQKLLTQTVYNLFGFQCPPITKKLIGILKEDMISSLSPHTLYKRVSFSPGGVPVPLLVCGGEHDVVIDQNLWQGWSRVFKPCDRLWQCPNGRYFCHYFDPQKVGETIVNFWDNLLKSSDVICPADSLIYD